MHRILVFAVAALLLLALALPASAQSGIPRACTPAELDAFVNGSLSARTLELARQFGASGVMLTDAQMRQYNSHLQLLMSSVGSLCAQAGEAALVQAMMLSHGVSASLAFNQLTGQRMSEASLNAMLDTNIAVMDLAGAIFAQWAE